MVYFDFLPTEWDTSIERSCITVALPKLNLLAEENRTYFYNILPYAYVMGLTDEWIKQLENIAVTPADWYRGVFDLTCDRPD